MYVIKRQKEGLLNNAYLGGVVIYRRAFSVFSKYVIMNQCSFKYEGNRLTFIFFFCIILFLDPLLNEHC